MSELITKKENLKKLLRQVHETPEKVGEIKAAFRHLLAGLTPTMIAEVEQELVEEGLPAEKLRLMCDVHLELMKESLDESEPAGLPPGHPIAILTKEHSQFLEVMDELRRLLASPLQDGSRKRLAELRDLLKVGENHYLREENVLFPQLEKRGIVQPPAIMWQEHDVIRDMKRRLFAAIDRLNSGNEGGKAGFIDDVIALQEFLSSHFQKENKILFPAALQVIERSVWPEMRREFDEIGYVFGEPAPIPHLMGKAAASGAPGAPGAGAAEKADAAGEGGPGLIDLGSGRLTIEQLTCLFNTLPVDITFVDADDRVAYFSETADRIFVRTRSVIGRAVQNCHPQKSVHVVNKILDDFKAGRRHQAEFWINLGNKLILIRYFAVRNPEGRYLGTVEITQDITRLKELTGEKRLDDDV
ncbi:MAG TPA: DUF438 domain-containing protein [Firmicutes bacterium]|nr:DUF438 domain-containing protein [Bacillota bacterium]